MILPVRSAVIRLRSDERVEPHLPAVDLPYSERVEEPSSKGPLGDLVRRPVASRCPYGRIDVVVSLVHHLLGDGIEAFSFRETVSQELVVPLGLGLVVRAVWAGIKGVDPARDLLLYLVERGELAPVVAEAHLEGVLVSLLLRLPHDLPYRLHGRGGHALLDDPAYLKPEPRESDCEDRLPVVSSPDHGIELHDHCLRVLLQVLLHLRPGPPDQHFRLLQGDLPCFRRSLPGEPHVSPELVGLHGEKASPDGPPERPLAACLRYLRVRDEDMMDRPRVPQLLREAVEEGYLLVGQTRPRPRRGPEGGRLLPRPGAVVEPLLLRAPAALHAEVADGGLRLPQRLTLSRAGVHDAASSLELAVDGREREPDLPGNPSGGEPLGKAGLDDHPVLVIHLSSFFVLVLRHVCFPPVLLLEFCWLSPPS